MKVFDFALKMEIDGKRYYEKLAADTSDAGLKNIFLRLAEDEEKHYRVFLELKDRAQPMAMEDTTALEESRNVFTGLMGHRQTVLNQMQGDLEGYRFAMKLEAESVRLYEEAAAQENDPTIRALLLRIAAEEQQHFNIMENVYDFFNAPNEYLAWREFSNLGEFRQFGRDIGL